MDKIKRIVIARAKMNGFTFKTDTIRYVCEILEPYESGERAHLLDRFIAALRKQPLEDSVIEISQIEAAVCECTNQPGDEQNDLLQVIDLFSAAKYEYDVNSNRFKEYLGELSLFGSAQSKANVYLNRIAIILQRTLRNELFSSGNSKAKFTLRTIESLVVASNQKKEAVVCLGMLSQLKADRFYLEDCTGHVELDLTEATFYNGLFTEGMIVLVEGSYESTNILKASGVGLTPVENAQETGASFENFNFFGAGANSNMAVRANEKLARLEAKYSVDATLVFLSDVWLDDENVLKALYHLFSGFSTHPPICFVLAGSFCSKPRGYEQIAHLREGFGRLADILIQFAHLANTSRFIFVPGPDDPFFGPGLPRAPLPDLVLEPLSSRVPNCIFVTNPARFSYGTQEICVFREDILEKICRNCIRMPSTRRDIPEHFAKTLQSQAHLTPLPIHVSPVYWDYDHCMRLYPLPDLVVICDKYQPFTERHKGCIISNPGSFSGNGFIFQVYLPSSRQIEDSAIDFE